VRIQFWRIWVFFWVVALVRRVTVSSVSNEHTALILTGQGVPAFQVTSGCNNRAITQDTKSSTQTR
jgi:hypothetical protein